MDRLALLAVALAASIVVVTAMRASDASMVLRRAEWACSRTHAETVVRRDPAPGGGSRTRLVSVPVCDAWVRR